MKLSYRALLDVYREVERELENHDNKSFGVEYSITEVTK